jgi:hypothetical protein
MTAKLSLRGLRGESAADIARRTLDITSGDKAALQALIRDDAEVAGAPAAAVAAAASAAAAQADRVAIMAALGVTGIAGFYDTKALANTALAGLAANAVVMVFVDESLSNARTIYRKEGGVYVLKANLSDDPVFTGDVTTTGGDFITNGYLRILQTYSEDHGNFSFETAGATFDGIKDPQLSYGYNRNLIFPDEPSLTVNMEVDYLSGGPSGVRTMEHYLQYTSADGLTQLRPFMFNIDRDDDQISFGFINVGVGGFTFQSTDLLTNLAKVTNSSFKVHKLGVGSNSEYEPGCELDVQGIIRSVGPASNPTTGAGLEMRYVPGSTKGRIICADYDDGGTYRDLDIEAATITLFAGTKRIATYADTFSFSHQRTPASATATGVKGDFCHDENYAYFCTATNVWKRVALSTWS